MRGSGNLAWGQLFFHYLDRSLERLQRHDVGHVAARLREIIEPFDVLQTYPLIECPASNDKRQQVISRGSHGIAARRSGKRAIRDGGN